VATAGTLALTSRLDHGSPSRWTTEFGNGRAYGVLKPRQFLGTPMPGLCQTYRRYARFTVSLV
jgi:hypothetical protein